MVETFVQIYDAKRKIYLKCINEGFNQVMFFVALGIIQIYLQEFYS